MSLQKCSRKNPLELVFKPLFKTLLPTFPHVNQSGNTASTKLEPRDTFINNRSSNN